MPDFKNTRSTTFGFGDRSANVSKTSNLFIDVNLIARSPAPN